MEENGEEIYRDLQEWLQGGKRHNFDRRRVWRGWGVEKGGESGRVQEREDALAQERPTLMPDNLYLKSQYYKPARMDSKLARAAALFLVCVLSGVEVGCISADNVCTFHIGGQLFSLLYLDEA